MSSPVTGRRHTVTTLLQSIFATTLGVLPAYLLGALAVQMRSDLHLNPSDIGIGAALLFGVTGLLSRPMGQLVQKRGATWGIVVSSGLALIALLGVAAAPSIPILYTALTIGGVGNAIAQPAANLGVSAVISPSRLGLALGIKQTAIPAATLMAGLAVPAIALTLGWRWVLLIFAGAAAALTIWALLQRTDAYHPALELPETDRGTPRAGLIIITTGAGLAAAAATSLGVFLVDSAVQTGMTPTAAGLLFAGSALLGMIVRVLLGAAMDRFAGRSPYVLVFYLLIVGSAGFGVLCFGEGYWLVLGSLVAYSAGWTWPGLIHYAIVRDNRRTAASATGVLQTGISLGGAAGPLLFGFLVDATSYDIAWVAAALTAVASATIIRFGRRSILRRRLALKHPQASGA
ncbi:MFS transporter [Arthrobacter sp. EH-1B-1]|uniref:MFS transporter n=1 Tax=Arthrobacter vasquezii TaxID=2977629 RepID=A0ABT6CUB4_9MICC|nr:MFS transporter [Arthrobacter vasquezii]MDF9277614.1 MFS transporter [Arthrobacter vasquezii]